MFIDGIETFDQNKIANGFDKSFTEIGPKFAYSIRTFSKDFKQFMNVSKTVLQEYTVQDDELEELFNSLKSNKSPGFDDILSYAVNFSICGIFHPLKHSFNLSLQTEIFPIGMSFTTSFHARVSPIFKKDEEFLFTNHIPISVLPCFSKLLKRLMYNSFYKYHLQNNLLYEKQFGLQASNSTGHAVIQLISQILDTFNEKKYAQDIFMDLNKAFDIVAHDILSKKLDMYGIKG